MARRRPRFVQSSDGKGINVAFVFRADFPAADRGDFRLWTRIQDSQILVRLVTSHYDWFSLAKSDVNTKVFLNAGEVTQERFRDLGITRMLT